jgi:hypothetical protein
MLTPDQITNYQTAYKAAFAAANAYMPWPLKISPEQYAECAATEAMIETGWLAHMPPNSNNCLGIKAYKGWPGAVVGATGTEQNPNGSWTGPQADLWCVFPSLEACFTEQLHILQEPRYAVAADSPTPESYIIAECKIWSTGIMKGQSVLSTYNAHRNLLSA